MKNPPRSSPLSVRLPPEMEARIDECAARLGLPKNALVRMAVDAAIEAIEANDYRLVLPLKFQPTHRPERVKEGSSYPDHRPDFSTAEDSPKPNSPSKKSKAA